MVNKKFFAKNYLQAFECQLIILMIKIINNNQNYILINQNSSNVMPADGKNQTECNLKLYKLITDYKRIQIN